MSHYIFRGVVAVDQSGRNVDRVPHLIEADGDLRIRHVLLVSEDRGDDGLRHDPPEGRRDRPRRGTKLRSGSRREEYHRTIRHGLRTGRCS